MGLNYNPASVIDGLVYYLDIMNTRCYSGTGNTLYNLANSAIGTTIVSGITYDTDFKKNLNFNGSSGYMFSNDTSLDFTNKDFTIQTTLKLNGLSNGFTGAYDHSICAGAALTNNSSIFYVNGTGTSINGIGLWHQPTSTSIEKYTNIQTNKIYNLAVTKNTTQIEFFVDGVSVGTASTTSSFNFTANGFAIGRWYFPGYEQYLKGSIFDFKAYNRALTNDEIVQNYNSSKGRYITPENIVTNGLVLNIDPANSSSYSGIGNTIYDLSGFGNTGTLTNGPTFSALNSGSIVLDGTNDYVSFSNAYASSFGITSNATISVWAKIIDENYYQPFIGFYNPSAGNRSDFGIDIHADDTLRIWKSDSASGTANTIFFDNWDHYVLTSDATSLKVYRNTILLQNASIAGTITNNRMFIIGSNWDGTGRINFSQVQIYNRTLSATEIQQNYNATKGRFGL
ncbi:hypothetical protein CCP3SC1AL1_1210005 [Gammaproteobacteria bacterium]